MSAGSTALMFKGKMRFETLLFVALACCTVCWVKADNPIDDYARELGDEEAINKIAFEETDRQISTFALESLNAHNQYRRKHGAPALSICPKLTKVAQNYAETIAKKDSLVHSNNDYGENLFASWGKEPNGREPVTAFYNEIKKYNFNSPGFSKETGHFTQVVWKATKMVGVGKAKSSRGTTYVVYNYHPPGNYKGQFAANVQRAQ